MAKVTHTTPADGTFSAAGALAWDADHTLEGVGDVIGPASATDNAIPRYDTTTGKLIQNSVVTIDDTGNEAGLLSQQFSDGTAVTVAAGKQWYNATTGSWNLGMGGGNITQQVGEELFVYGKASASITDSPLKIVYQTGQVGASGIVTFAPTVSGITDGNRIIGVATENITSGNFGRITSYGVIHGITTNGTAYGETWVDGDEIWYNPVTGNPTNVKPSAPNIKVSVGTIINAGSSGSGSIQVEVNHGSVLGGTDSNVQLTSVANNNLLQYDSTAGYWKNVATIPNTNLANSSITINGSAISLGGSVSVGTVTSVAAITLGTTGTDLSSTVATGTTTPVITLNVPTASATNRGALSSTDWSTFNNKQAALVSGTNIKTVNGTTLLGSGNLAVGTVTSVSGTAPISVATGTSTPAISISQATTSTNGYLSSTDWTTFNNKTSNTGTVTSVAATAGTGISVTGSPITTSGTLTITNTAPDQVVSLTGSGATSISGTYPNFTISSTNTTYGAASSTVAGLIELGSDTVQTVASNAVSATASRSYALQVNASGQGVVNVPWTDTNSGGTVTSITAGTGLSGGTITGSGTIALANTAVTAGAYTNANITVDAQGRLTAASSGAGGSGTVTSVAGTGTVNGLTLTGTVTTSGNLTLGGTLDLSSPPAIGATAANTGKFTSLTATSGLGGGAF